MIQKLTKGRNKNKKYQSLRKRPKNISRKQKGGMQIHVSSAAVERVLTQADGQGFYIENGKVYYSKAEGGLLGDSCSHLSVPKENLDSRIKYLDSKINSLSSETKIVYKLLDKSSIPWGFPGPEYKKSISFLVDIDAIKKFSYQNIINTRRFLEPLISSDQKYNHKQIWSSQEYIRPSNGRSIPNLTASELTEMDFGLKQKCPFYIEEKGVFKDMISDKASWTSSPNDKFTDEEMDNLKENSYHQIISNTCMQANGILKTGKSTKFFNKGCNACINAIITRFDNDGNVQMMAMIRPSNADSDPSEYQMSAGCIFFQEDLSIGGFEIKKGSTPYLLTSNNIDEPPNIDEDTSQLQNKALAYARAAVYEKLWHSDELKAEIEKWDFYKMAAGIVDDTANTSQSWVETSYVIHHIMGTESNLSLFENSFINPNRKNVGDAVWRSIDSQPTKYPVKSQISVEIPNPLVPGDFSFQKEEVEHVHDWKYDPFKEWENWHGDHSFIANMLCGYVKSFYKYERPGEYGFGISSEIN